MHEATCLTCLAEAVRECVMLLLLVGGGYVPVFDRGVLSLGGQRRGLVSCPAVSEGEKKQRVRLRVRQRVVKASSGDSRGRANSWQ